MNIKWKIYSVALLALLVSCSINNLSGKTTLFVPTSSMTAHSLATSTIIPINTVEPESTLVKTLTGFTEPECLDIETKKLDDIQSYGSILMESQEIDADGFVSKDAYQYNLETGIRKKLNDQNTYLSDFTVSPDRTKYAVIKLFNSPGGNLSNEQILLYSAKGELLKILAWDWEDTWPVLFGWIDDHRLVMTIHEKKTGGESIQWLTTWVVVNIKTEEKIVLRSSYPNIYSFPPLPDWQGAGITMYDPSLTRVFYLSWDQKNQKISYTLYDLEHQEKILTLDMCCSLQTTPHWSPDGKNLALAPVFLNNNYPPYEIYDITRDGAIKRLTFLSDEYPFIYISDLSWSPDGTKIAFWFSHEDDYGSVSKERLAIVDLASGKVYQYCITGDSEASPQNPSRVPAPLWSLDSEQIVVQSWFSKDHSRVILLDPRQNAIVDVVEDMKPIGWLSK